jgi:hypothetical protein
MNGEETSYSKPKYESTSSNSPILQRTSDFYDEFGYDSVSAISGDFLHDLFVISTPKMTSTP